MQYIKNIVTLEIDSEQCVGCGVCLEVCPREVLQIKAKKAVTVKKDQCIECGACRTNCAFNAITLHTGTGCAYAVINGWVRGTEPACDCGSGCC